jgi:hypothetical protein
MARKQRSQIKWKQIGCSIIGVGILSCGAGYSTRRPGYLIHTGPAEVRIEQPRLRSQVYDLESSVVPEPVAADQLGGNDTTTNAPPALRKNHISVSSRPDPTPPASNVLEPQQSVEDLEREFLPNGFSEDLFDEPLLNDKVNLRLFLDYFQTDQMQQNAIDPNQVDALTDNQIGSPATVVGSEGAPALKDQTTPSP